MKFPAKAILMRDVVDRFLIKVIQIGKNTSTDFFQKQESTDDTKFNSGTQRDSVYVACNNDYIGI